MNQREHYDHQLNGIRQSVIQMGETVIEMTRLVCDAVVQKNPELARLVVSMDDKVDFLEDTVLRDIIVVTMRTSPVAADLKFLLSTASVIGELEQAGDDAAKVARRVIKLNQQFPSEMNVLLMDMGREVREGLAQALKLFAEYSQERADQIIDSDDAIDAKYRDARHDLIDHMRSDPDQLRNLIRSIDLFHGIEHIGDHSVEIAKRLMIHYGTTPA